MLNIVEKKRENSRTAKESPTVDKMAVDKFGDEEP